MFATDVEEKHLWVPLEDVVWAGVWHREMCAMAIHSDEDVGRGGEILGYVGLSAGVMSHPHWSKFLHDLLKAMKVGWRSSSGEEFSRDNQKIAIHYFSCRDIEAFLWSRTKPEEDPGKLMESRGVDAARDEGGLGSTMKTFNHAIGFRV